MSKQSLFAHKVQTAMRLCRIAKGWSQRDLADKIDVDAKRISAIETGVRPLPDDLAKQVNKLLKIGIPTSDLGTQYTKLTVEKPTEQKPLATDPIEDTPPQAIQQELPSLVSNLPS